jgi:hypothetical protein
VLCCLLLLLLLLCTVAVMPPGAPFSPDVLRGMLDIIKLRPGSTVVDVGGNLGSYSIFFAAATGPEGKVYSFEPQRKMFQVRVCCRVAVAGCIV